MKSKYEKLLVEQRRKLLKALQYLDYSYHKICKLPDNPEELDEESLETWESFVARFARVVDLFLSKYLRSVVLANDPGFSGTLRDFVNQGEKLHLLDDAAHWMNLRELRNISAHEYTEEELRVFFANIKKECPLLLQLSNKLSYETE